MLIPRETLADLRRRLEGDAAGLRVVAAEAPVDPLDLVAAGSHAFGTAGFFSSPDGTTIGWLGAAHRIAASGPGRLRVVDQALADLPHSAPVMTGFGFGDEVLGTDWEGFAPAVAVVPEAAIVQRAGEARLVLALPPGADGDGLIGLLAALRADRRTAPFEVDHTVESRPSPADYRDLVGEGVAAIESGAMSKVVLARTVIVRRPSPLDAFQILDLLRSRHPDCRVYGWQEGDAVFAGASPELLISRAGRHVAAAPLAGSAARDDDPETDRRLGEALLKSAKDRHEHELVVNEFSDRLDPLVEALHRPAAPQLQRFNTVQHLATPISAATDERVLTLADAVHPTGAVGGVPRAEALRFIEKMEGIDRGWYGGGIGWLGPDGDGELAVSLRCALIRADRAVLFAGNGIVAESDADAEVEETRLKLRPLLDVLT